jgi:hypothetical protein
MLTHGSSGGFVARPADAAATRSTSWATPYVLAQLASALVLLAGCFYAVACCSSDLDFSGHTRGADDAYITYRYAQHWVHGDGLVFNAGERVEGYTNLLYVALMTLPCAGGLDPFRCAIAINTVFMTLAFVAFVRHIRAKFGAGSAASAAILFATSSSLWIWVSSGLETPLVFLLQTAIWVHVDRLDDRPSRRDAVVLAALVALLVLTRADGFVTGAIAVAYLAARRRWQGAGVAGLAVFVTLVTVLLWRHAYYGEIWPNTYYAKVSSPIAFRLRSSAHEFIGVLARQGLLVYVVVLGFSATRAIAKARAIRPGAALVRAGRFDLAFSAAWIVYWLCIGGDVFEDRFLIVLIPPGISALLRAVASSGRMAGLVVALAAAVQLAVPVRGGRYGASPNTYDRWVTLGKFLHEERPGRLLAIDAAGKVPFFSGLRTVDMLGLNDRYIAHIHTRQAHVGHDKYDADYVLSRKPDLIATWIDDDSLDLRFGLTRCKYEQAGYRIAFLVNARAESSGKDIIDVRNRDDRTIVSLWRAGYGYAVAERKPAIDRESTPQL